MEPEAEQDTGAEVLAASDACFISFRDHNNEKFQSLISEASSQGYLGLLLGHWVGVSHQVRPPQEMPPAHDDHAVDDAVPRTTDVVLELLNAEDEEALTTLVEAVADWRTSKDGLRGQIEVAVGLMVLLERCLPAGILPSHCFIVADVIHRSAKQVGDADMGWLLTRIASQMWHDKQSAAMILVEEGLGVRKLRRAIEILARSVAEHQPPGQAFTVITGDRARYSEHELRLIDAGARMVNLSAAGKRGHIDIVLRTENNVTGEVETRALALTLAWWLSIRIRQTPPFRVSDAEDAIRNALSYL